MWLKQAWLRKTLLITQTKTFVRYCASAICLYAAVSFGQSFELVEITDDDQRLIQVSPEMAAEVQDPRGGLTLKRESRGSALRFIADTPRGEARSRWYDTDSKPNWIVYATGAKRFLEVETQLRVELKNESQLPQLAKELGAVRAKFYEGLDYGLLWFDSKRNPITLAKRLEGDERVTRTRLQFKKAIWLPQ